MNRPGLILASASPRRRELLSAIGLRFEVVPADIDESLQLGPARDIATGLSIQKARAVQQLHPNRLIVAADTIVSIDGRLLGKPEGPADAHEMLLALRGRWHEVTTGIAVIEDNNGRLAQSAVATRVLMREYSDAEIASTIAAGTPFDKAGAYAIQDEVFHPVERHDGCYCNVVGLPLWTLLNTLESLSVLVGCRDPAVAFDRCVTCPERHSDAEASVNVE